MMVEHCRMQNECIVHTARDMHIVQSHMIVSSIKTSNTAVTHRQITDTSCIQRPVMSRPPTPSSPTSQRIKSVPKVASSPLRPNSPPNSNSTLIPSNARRASLGVGQTPSTKTPPKTRARDLLRKHYGLGVGPPPPLPGRSNDPMDLGASLEPEIEELSISPSELLKIRQHLMQSRITNNL